MDDLISRKAVINALINLWADKPFGNPALTEIKECVERVPSAEPEHEYTMEEFMDGQDMGNPEDGGL